MSIKADEPEHGDGWTSQDPETRETAQGNTPVPNLSVSACWKLPPIDDETPKGSENFGSGKLLRRRPLIRLSRSIVLHHHSYPPSLFFASIVHTWSSRGERHEELIFSRGFLHCFGLGDVEELRLCLTPQKNCLSNSYHSWETGIESKYFKSPTRLFHLKQVDLGPHGASATCEALVSLQWQMGRQNRALRGGFTWASLDRFFNNEKKLETSSRGAPFLEVPSEALTIESCFTATET